MIKLIWRTDVHLSDKSPRARTDVWSDTVLGKLLQVGRLAAHLKADAVIDGGDFFHIKSPGRNSHDLIRRVAEVHRSYPCPVYANIGNHDCVYGDMAYLPQQPLGVLFSTGVFKRLYDHHEAVFEKDGVTVRVVGVPYHGPRYDLERFRSLKKGDEDHLVCVAHVLASAKGGQMFQGEDILSYGFLNELEPDAFCFGHWHQDQGVTRLPSGKWIVNIGSLTRGSLSDDNLAHQPGVVAMLLSKSEIKMQLVRLRVQAAEEVFDVRGKVRSEANTRLMEDFVGKMQGALESSSVDSVRSWIESEDLPYAVKEKALFYIEQVEE